jgi:hypothetical protein
MLTTASNAPHVYIQSDVPDGMTLVEWRRAHSEPRPRGLTARLRDRAASTLRTPRR